MHLLTWFFLLWPLITLCYHQGVLSYLWRPQLSQKISNIPDSYLDLTDLHSKWSILLFSESKCAYSGTYNLDTSVFMPSDSSMTRKCEYLSNMHYIDYIWAYIYGLGLIIFLFSCYSWSRLFLNY